MTTLSDEISSALEAEVAAVVDVLLESFCDPDAIGDPIRMPSAIPPLSPTASGGISIMSNGSVF